MRTVRRLVLGVLPGALLLSSPLLAQVPLLPRPEGTHPVGYWRTTHAVGRDSSRILLLEIWYPASGSPGATFKPYASLPVMNALAAQLDLRAGWDKAVTTHAIEGTAVLSGTHPVVIFSHGLSWPMTLYQAFTEDLASRGYVVIGINHPGGAIIDYGGGRVLPFAPLPDAPTDSARNAALARLTAVWAVDITAVLAQLPVWANGSTPLSGHVDLTRIALMGHSLGASASALLTSNKRVRTVVALEGVLRDTAQATLVVAVPFLHVIGGYNRLELENRNYRPSTGAPVYQVIVQGTGHAYFSDLMAIYKTTADSAWLGRHRYEVEPLRVIQITRDYAAAFLARYLLDQDSSLLHPVGYAAKVEGPRAAGYPEVEMTIDLK